MRPILLLLALIAVAAAAEDAAPAKPEPAATDADAKPAAGDAPPTAPAAPPAAPAAPAAQPDPTAAVVAQAKFVYRARDIDALALIAARHAKRKLTRLEEEQLRQALAIALPAREPLIDALRRLPALPGAARDQLVLDLIDYQAEPAAPPAAGGNGADAVAANGGDAADGEVLVRLPPLSLTRDLAGIGKRQLTLALALYFHDGALAKKLESKAPLIQDAVLGHLNQLPPNDFVNPNHEALKLGLAAAIAARVQDFPGDGVLITQLEVEEPAPGAAPAKGAPTANAAAPASGAAPSAGAAPTDAAAPTDGEEPPAGEAGK